MKRSEMLEYLAKNLRRKDQYVTTNMDQCRYLVGLVLDSCETKGMLPPPKDTDPEAWIGEFFLGYDCEWEPEDG